MTLAVFDVAAARRLWAAGCGHRVIGAVLGVPPSTVHRHMCHEPPRELRLLSAPEIAQLAGRPVRYVAAVLDAMPHRLQRCARSEVDEHIAALLLGRGEQALRSLVERLGAPKSTVLAALRRPRGASAHVG